MYDTVKWKVVLIVLVIAGAVFFATQPVALGPDLGGGTELTYKVAGTSGDESSAEKLKAVKKTIEKRLTGLESISITPTEKTLIIKLPDMSPEKIAQYKNRIETAGELTLRLSALPEIEANWLRTAWNKDTGWQPNAEVPAGYVVREWPLKTRHREIPDPKGLEGSTLIVPEKMLLESKDVITGGMLKRTSPTTDYRSGAPVISFALNKKGSEFLDRMTTTAAERSPHGSLVIVLDGKVESAPVVSGPLTDGTGIITMGGGTDRKEQERRRNDLLATIQAGTLDTKLELQYQFTTAASLGKDQIDKGVYSIAAAFICVMIFMLLYYLGAGLVANVALVTNLVLVFGLMNAFEATFSLAGIAGLILTVGMAVDANILIFERIREEKNKGKTLAQAVKNGYERAFRTIIDANVTTLITALILYWMGSVEIRGFAVTLSLGILCSMFTSLVITKVIFTLLIRAKIFRSVKMLKLMGVPKIDFVSLRRGATVFSVSFILIGLVAFFVRGNQNFGLDFLGGSRYHLVMRQTMPIEEVRAKIAKVIDDADIQSIEPQDRKGVDSVPETEFVIAVSDLEVHRLEKEYRDENPSDPTRQGQEIAKELILAQLQGKGADPFVPAGWPEQNRIDPAQGTMALPLGKKVTLQEEVTVRNLLRNALLYYEDSIDLKPQSDQLRIRGVDFTEKSFAERRDAIGAALAKTFDWDDEKKADFLEQARSEPATAEKGELFFTVVVELPKPTAGGRAVLPEGLLERFQKELHDKQDELKEQADKARKTYALPGNEKAMKRVVVTAFEVTEVKFAGTPPSWVDGSRNFAPVHVSATWTVLEDTTGAKLDLMDNFSIVKEQIKDGLQGALPKGAVAREETIKKTVAEDFRRSAFFSIVLALLAIVGYIWIRFRHLRYGLAAVIALAHDVLFTLGALALLALVGIEVKIDLAIVAAFLTIVGYSLNDTIVVFDRIRENAAGRHPRHFMEDVNKSINQTLSRTVLTSLTTLLVVSILAAFGGGIIRGFAISMIVGVLVGTYSSIFIASPVVVWLHGREEKKKANPATARRMETAAP